MAKRCKSTLKTDDAKETEECIIVAERDMISDLPDAILSHILGKLPTKYAVGTSVLSTRWKHLFAQIPYPDISINDSDFLNPNQDSDYNNYQFLYNRRKDNFIDFMYNLLNVTLHDVPRIRKIHLEFHHDQWSGDDDDDELFNEHVSKWVDTALKLNVSYLKIFCARSYLETPASLCRCASLVEIILDWRAEFFVPSSVSVCLPNLKSLYLKHVVFHDDDLRKVLSGCPVLEELCLCYCEFTAQRPNDLLGVRVFSPSVKMFKWFHCVSEYKFGIELDMPTLNFLWFDDFPPDYFLVKNLDSLCKAHILVWPTCKQCEGSGHNDRVRYLKNVADLILGCSKVEFLSLSNHSIEAFSRSFTLSYPYYNLIELELYDIDDNGWKHLPCLLKNAPNLEVLVFAKDFRVFEGCYEIFLSHIGQCPTQLVPKLQRIRFEYFDGEFEIESFVNFFLKNAKMLKKIDIKLPLLCEKKLVKAASTVEVLQKMSKKCQIERIFGDRNNDSDRSFAMRKFE